MCVGVRKIHEKYHHVGRYDRYKVSGLYRMVGINNVSCLTMTAKYDLGASYPNFRLVHQLDVQGSSRLKNAFGSGSGGLYAGVHHHWKRRVIWQGLFGRGVGGK